MMERKCKMSTRNGLIFVAVMTLCIDRNGIYAPSIFGPSMSGGNVSSQKQQTFALGYIFPLASGVVKSFRIMLEKSESGKDCTVDLLIFRKVLADRVVVGKETYTPLFSGYHTVPISTYINVQPNHQIGLQFNSSYCVWEKTEETALVYRMPYVEYTVGSMYNFSETIFGTSYHVQIELAATFFGFYESELVQQYHKSFLLNLDSRLTGKVNVAYDEQVICYDIDLYDIPMDIAYEYEGFDFPVGGQVYGTVLHYLFTECVTHKITFQTVDATFEDLLEVFVSGCDSLPLSDEIMSCLKNGSINLSITPWEPTEHRKNKNVLARLDNTALCLEGINVSYQWKIFNITFLDQCSVTSLNESNVLSLTVNTTSRNFILDGGSLSYGSYIICVETGIEKGSETFVWRNFGFIKVIKSDIVPVLYGGFSRYHLSGLPLVMNATDSHDPDELFHLEQFRFNWSCSLINDEECDFNLQPSLNIIAGPTFTIPASMLSKNTTYIFSVLATVPDGRNMSLTQNVYVFIALDLVISCATNCLAKVITKDELILQAGCINCNPGEVLHYSWELYNTSFSNPVSAEELVNKTSSGINGTTIVFKSDTLKEGTLYYIKVTGVNQYLYSVTQTYNFTTDMPPSMGKCEISPTMGYNIVTDFKIECSGFVDDDLPMTYRIYSFKNKVLYTGSDALFVTKLEAGDSAENYTSTLIIEVLDAYSVGVSTTVDVMVQPYSSHVKVEVEDNSTISDAVDYLYDTFNATKTAETVTEYKSEFVQYLYDVAAVLNEDVESTSDNEENSVENAEKVVKRKQVREAAVEMLENVTMNSIDSIQHISSVVYEVTKKSSDMTKKAAKSVVKIMTSATAAFKNIEDLSSEEEHKAAENILKGIDNLLSFEQDVAESLWKQNTVNIQNKTQTEMINTTVEDLKDSQEMQEVRDRTKKSLDLVDDIADTLLNNIQNVSETTIKYEVGSMTLELEKTSLGKLKNRVYEPTSSGQTKGATFLFPNTSNLSVEDDLSEVNVKLLYFENNPYQWSEQSVNIKTPVIDMTLETKNNTIISVTDTPEPFDIIIPLKESIPKTHIFVPVMQSKKTGERYFGGTLITQRTKPGIPNILFLKINNNSYKLKVYVDTKNISGINFEREAFTYPQSVQDLLKHRTYTQNESIIFLPPISDSDCAVDYNCTYYIGITVDGDPDNLVLLNKTELKFEMFSSALDCVFWNETEEKWLNKGCKATALSSFEYIHCWCNHLTAFAGSSIILPNFIDPFDIFLFTTFFDNPVVISVVIVIWLVYFGLLVWARNRDQQDICKRGITVLSTNPRNIYCYLVCTVTGWWRNASTTSNVFMYIKGDHGQSPKYFLCNRMQDLFQLGAEDWFLIFTPFCIGELQNITVWHDRSGIQSSWFLKEIRVYDLQTNQQWNFLYNDWLSTHHGVGIVRAVIPVLRRSEMSKKKFSQFTLMTGRELRNSHIWISIFVKPNYSRFTRVQRLSCAVCLLLLLMLTNIMFYGIPTDDPADQIAIDNIVFSLSSIIIGIESSVIIFPISLMIIQLFERSSSRKEFPRFDIEIYSNFLKQKEKRAQIIFKRNYGMRKETFMLSWWCRYVAWVLLVISALTASYFVMLYGLHYGYDKSVDWLISFITSFLQSCCILQPLKAICIAAVITQILRKPVDLRSDGEKLEPTDLESYFENLKKEATSKMEAAMNYISPPPDRNLMRAVRKRLRMDKKSNEALQDMITYFIYLGLALFIIHSQNDVWKIFHTTDSINMNLINSFSSFEYMNLDEIKTTEDVWMYILDSLIPKIYSEVNAPFAADDVSFLIGPIRLRQVRSSSVNRDIQLRDIELSGNHCIPYLIKTWDVDKLLKKASCSNVGFLSKFYPNKGCIEEFTFGYEDTKHYSENWKKELNSKPNSSINYWVYHTAWELTTFPYSGHLATYPGGGYIVTLSGDGMTVNLILWDLELTDWINKNTAALFIEFTLFNPPGNTFSTVVLLVEFSVMGEVFTSSKIFTNKLYLFNDELDIAVAVFQIIFLFQTVVLTIYEVRRFRKEKLFLYLKDTWRCIEILILILGFTSVGLYLQKIILIRFTLNRMKESQREDFINFYLIAFWDKILNYVSAFLSSILLLKVIYLCKFNVKMTLLSETLRRSGVKLLSFILYFFLALTTFSHSGTLLFGHSLYHYRNFGSTVLSLMNYLLGIADYYGLQAVNPVLGSIYYCVFFVFGHYYLSNLLIALVLDAFRTTRRDTKYIPNEAEVVDYIWNKILLLTAKKKDQQ